MNSPSSPVPPFAWHAIWDRLDPATAFDGDWCQFRHAQQVKFLHELVRHSRVPIQLGTAGLSDEGCVLNSLQFGNPEGRRVLIWARQHGDEPDCSAALAMVLRELTTRPEDPVNAFILNRLSLMVLPMVNPDGVARFTRRNAQGIDLNRDAIALATPEARALKGLKDKFDPEFCFNLHDMNPRKSARGSDLVAIAFQAGPFEPRDVDNEVRLKAKGVVGAMARQVRHLAPRNYARYTADYMHRAFGDSMMRWGVSSILIEAGGWYDEQGGDTFVRRLFALALLRGLHAVGAGEDALPGAAESYEELPFDSANYFTDYILEGGRIVNGYGRPPFRADLSLNVNRIVGRTRDPIYTLSAIQNIGDLEDHLAKTRVDFTGHVIAPGFTAACPGLSFPGVLPTAEQARTFLRAGITTIALGFGPFHDRREREDWLHDYAAQNPPINIVAFENVRSIEDIRRRHGMTQMAGFLVPGLQVLPEDIIQLAHLFHPAHHSAIEEARREDSVAVDLYFQPAASPGSTRLHLHLSHPRPGEDRTFVTSGDLIRFTNEFLNGPSQITFGLDAGESPFGWLPLLIAYGGLSHGRLPDSNFLGQILAHYNVQDESGVVAVFNMLLMRGLGTFRLGATGHVGIDQRADLLAFPESILDGPRAVESGRPRWVMLNGRIVLNEMNDGLPDREAVGTWVFAGGQATPG
jgi:hypothetical protein